MAWYCYRGTDSRRSHLTYTPTERDHTGPKKISFGKIDTVKFSVLYAKIALQNLLERVNPDDVITAVNELHVLVC